MASELYLSMEDLALVMDGGLFGISDEGLATLVAMVAEDPRFDEQLADLRTMALDAECGLLGDGLQAHQQIEQLLTAASWGHPAEVLGGEREDIAYSRLIRVAAARAERDKDPGRVLAVKRRLMGAYAEHLAERAAGHQAAE